MRIYWCTAITVTALIAISCDSNSSNQQIPQVIVFKSHTVGDTLFVQNDYPENPSNPIEVIHELDIGGENASDDVFGWSIRDFDVDENGNLFVLENNRWSGARVFWIDNSGNVIDEWGRFGEGPTDIGHSSNIVVFPSGLIGLLSESLVRVFSRDGRLVSAYRTVEGDATHEFSYSTINQLYHIEATGVTVAYAKRMGAPLDPILYQVALIRDKGSKALLLAEFKPENGKYDEGSRGTVVPWVPELQYAATQSGFIYWGNPTEFRFNRLDINNGTYMVVDCSKDKEPTLQSEINHLADYESRLFNSYRSRDEAFYLFMNNRVPYPRYKAHYDKILADTDGSVWIRDNIGGQRLKFVPKTESDVEYFMFDKNGKFLGIVEAPNTISKLAGEYCYAINIEENTGAQLISRYRIVEVRR